MIVLEEEHCAEAEGNPCSLQSVLTWFWGPRKHCFLPVPKKEESGATDLGHQTGGIQHKAPSFLLSFPLPDNILQRAGWPPLCPF